jgi:succinate dehydrogenase hydrophobic anchor subunit
MEAAVGVFEERLDKIDTTDLEADREKSETVAVHQEVHNAEAAVETIGALWDTATHGKSGPRTVLYEPLKDERSRRDNGLR